MQTRATGKYIAWLLGWDTVSASLGPETPDQYLPLPARSLIGGGRQVNAIGSQNRMHPASKVLGVGVEKFPDDRKPEAAFLKDCGLGTDLPGPEER